MPIVIAIFFGAIVGSFLNVCILRLPKGESLVAPDSHCLSCQRPILWFENIPVLSFLFLKGRCRHCHEKISWQYPIIEVVSAALFVIFYNAYGFTPKGVFYLAATLALLVVSLIDFRHQIIPDEISLSGIVIGLIASTVFPGIQEESSWVFGFLKSALGIVVGGGFLFLAGTIAEKILKKEAMGGGDVKLMAMIGALTGLPGVVWTVFVSSLLGSAVGVYLRMKKGEERIPFGPYLAVAAVLYFFYGHHLIASYLSVIY